MGQAKILVGTPTYSGKFYCLSEWVENIQRLNYNNFDVLLVDNSKDDTYKKRIESLGVNCIKSDFVENQRENLKNARNIFFEYALSHDYDYVLSVEQDVFPSANTLQTLLKHDKPIVGALYMLGQFADNKLRRKIDWICSCADLKKTITLPDNNEAMYWLLLSEVQGKGLLQVRSCCFGCVLISSSTLHEIKPRVVSGLNRFDDYYFFEDCLKKNIPVYTDTDLLVNHYPGLGGGSGWMQL